MRHDPRNAVGALSYEPTRPRRIRLFEAVIAFWWRFRSRYVPFG